jgi:hypothetical protein
MRGTAQRARPEGSAAAASSTLSTSQFLNHNHKLNNLLDLIAALGLLDSLVHDSLVLIQQQTLPEPPLSAAGDHCHTRHGMFDQHAGCPTGMLHHTPASLPARHDRVVSIRPGGQ